MLIFINITLFIICLFFKIFIMQMLKNLFTFEKLYFYDLMTFVHWFVQIFVLIWLLLTVFLKGQILYIFLIPILIFFIRFVFEMWIVFFSINDKLEKINNKITDVKDNR